MITAPKCRSVPSVAGLILSLLLLSAVDSVFADSAGKTTFSGSNKVHNSHDHQHQNYEPKDHLLRHRFLQEQEQRKLNFYGDTTPGGVDTEESLSLDRRGENSKSKKYDKSGSFSSSTKRSRSESHSHSHHSDASDSDVSRSYLSQSDSIDTDSSGGNSIDVDVTVISGAEILGSNVEQSESDAVCRSVLNQEPPTDLPQASTREFSSVIDVVYESDEMSSADMESYLDQQNLAMALWIAGCEDDGVAIDTSTGKRRNMRPDPSIFYSEVDGWETTGTCAETGSSENSDLPESSSPLCQQEFSSTIRLQADDGASSEDLTNRIEQAFDATAKLFLESQKGVVAVAIRDLNEETIEQESKVDGLEGEIQSSMSQKPDNRRTIIIASIVGACVFMCLVLLVLIALYEKLHKASYANNGFLGKVAHVPFVDELGESVSEESSGRDLLLVTTNNIKESDDYRNKTILSDNSIFDGVDDGSEVDLPPIMEISACFTAPPQTPVPFDEYDNTKTCSSPTCQICEDKRQSGVRHSKRSRSALIKAIDSSAPVTKVPMNVTPSTVIVPRIERRPLRRLDADASRRHYVYEDLEEV